MRRDKLGVLTKLMRYVFLMENQIYSFYFFFIRRVCRSKNNWPRSNHLTLEEDKFEQSINRINKIIDIL